jgi:hypothetical protein
MLTRGWYVLDSLGSVRINPPTSLSVADGAVTLAKLADLATQRVIGRNTGSTGVPEAVTLSQLLDWIGSATRGDILVRGASTWSRLAASTAGLFLGANGASLEPSWQAANGVASPYYFSAAWQLYALSPSSVVGVGIASPGTLTGIQAPAGGTFSDAYYVQFLTTTTNNSQGTLANSTGTGVGPINFLWDFDVVFIVRTDASAITTLSYWIGIFNGNPGTGDSLAANGIGFRYSTVAGDGGWVGVTYDGTQAVTGTVSSIAANTRYALRIRKVSGTVFFSVNGGTETSTSTHVPTNDVYRVPVANVTNRIGGAGTARSIYFSRAFANYGT